jgi:tetratricopeptide (TPR) repeat protein
MTKDNLLFGIIGLLVGVIAGFMAANNINRGTLQPPPNSASMAAAPAANPNLPPDHPPVGSFGDQTPDGSFADQTPNAPLPEIKEAVEKAKKQPKDFEAQMTAGDLYYQVQRFDEAAKFYEQANKLKPDEQEPIVKLGNAFFDAEKFEQAEKWYQAALAKDPNDVDVRTDLGLTFFLRTPRDIDRAIREYQASLSIDPDHEITLQNLVIAYREKNDTENLQKAAERLRKVNPNNPAISGSSAK